MSERVSNPVITFVALCLPSLRGIGWEQRSFSFIAAYSRFARVNLICLPVSDERAADRSAAIDTLRELCESVVVVPGPFAAPGTPPATNRDPLNWPEKMRQHWRSDIREYLQSSIAASDLVHTMRMMGLSLIRDMVADEEILFDLDGHPTAVARRRIKSQLDSRPSARLPEDLIRVQNFLNLRTPAFARTFVSSQVEKRFLPPCERIKVIPNSVPLPRTTRDARTPEPGILFVGSLRFEPNVDAVSFFIQEVLPLIVEQIPAVTLEIVGRGPDTPIRPYITSERVRVSCDVAEVDEYYARAAISVAPIRIGGGTRTKILESFAFGVPVVSTSFGCLGLDVAGGAHLLVANRAQSFAEACVSLLRDPQQRHSLATNARALIEQRYSSEVIQAQIEREMRGLDGVAWPPLGGSG